MAYTKIVYQNSPSTATPLNAENLNHMDDQIALNDQRLTEIETSYVKSFNGRKGEVTPQSGDYNIGQITPLTGAQVGQVPVVVNHGTEQDPELVFEMGVGGGGGHSIIDSEGNTMPQESAMQFADSFVSDDDANGRTVVENVKEVTLAELEQATERGMYLATDEESVPIGEIEKDYVEVTADGNKTYTQLLTELKSGIDKTKLQYYSTIVLDKQTSIEVHNIVYWDTNTIVTSCVFTNYAGVTETDTFYFGNSVKYQKTIVGNVTDMSSEKPTNGTVIILHYGSSSGIVELNTEVSYSMAERKIGKWIDGSDLYEKTVDIEALPNATNKFVSHGITNLDKVISIEGFASNGTIRVPLPYVGMVSTDGVQVYANDTKIVIATGGNSSAYSGYVTLRYTKS